MRRRGTPVSREALYEEVWTDAVTVVAPRYGLSDVGLVKICKKLGIPVPPRGYWAKLKAGRPTRKVPLPALPAGARDPSGPIPLSEQEAAMHARVRDALQQTRESQPNLSVPDELVGPHPLVRAKTYRSPRTLVNDTPYPYLDIYGNAALTLTGRVHAAAAALQYGKPAMLFTSSPRVRMLDRLGLEEIVNRPVWLDSALLEDEKGEVKAFIKDYLG